MTRFDFRFAPSYRLAALPFGVTPATARVEVTGSELLVRFGPWSLRTPLRNVAGVERTGGFAFVRTAGPPHLSLHDRGVSFATNGDDALCVRFHEPAPRGDAHRRRRPRARAGAGRAVAPAGVVA